MSSERSRDRGEGPFFDTTTVFHNDVVTGTPTYPVYETDESMVDYVTPDYHRLIASGAIINNPVSYAKNTFRTEGGGYIRAFKNIDPNDIYEYIGGSITQTGVTYSWNFTSVGHLPVVVDDGIDIAKFYAIANIDSTPYAFLEDSFEIRETLRFLRNPVGGLVKLSKEFKKIVKSKVPRSPAKLAKRISDVWLEYRFAFSPLLRSVDEAIDYLGKDHTKVPERRTARGFSTDKNQYPPNTFFGRTYNHFASPTWWFNRGTERKIDARAGILYTVSNPVEGVRFDLGVRNKDIPETIWAILPYSFMVDRVANISKSIRGLTNLLDPSVEILAGWVVTKDETKTWYQLYEHRSNGWTVTTIGDKCYREKFVYNRVVWSPSVSDTVPPVSTGGLVKDASSIADLLALVFSNITH